MENKFFKKQKSRAWIWIVAILAAFIFEPFYSAKEGRPPVTGDGSKETQLAEVQKQELMKAHSASTGAGVVAGNNVVPSGRDTPGVHNMAGGQNIPSELTVAGKSAGTSAHVQKWLSDVRSDWNDVIAMAEAWDVFTEVYNEQFDSSKVSKAVEKIYNPNASVEEIDSIISICLQYVSDYTNKLYSMNYSAFSRFQPQVQFNISRLYTTFKLNRELYKQVNAFGLPDNEVAKVVPSLRRDMDLIEAQIRQFAFEYNGYFDKQAFVKQIAEARSSKSVPELKARLTSLANCSHMLLMYDMHYGGNTWNEVNSELTALLERLNHSETNS